MGCVVALLGVLMGVAEVRESCDGGEWHTGNGAPKVAGNTNNETVDVPTGSNVSD